MPARTLQEEAELLLVKPPPAGVWLDVDEVEKVLRALEEGREAQRKLADLVALVSPAAPVKRRRLVPPAPTPPTGVAGDVLCKDCGHPKGAHANGETFCCAPMPDMTQCMCLKFSPGSAASDSAPKSAGERRGAGEEGSTAGESQSREAATPNVGTEGPGASETGPNSNGEETARCASCSTATERICDPEAVGEKVEPFRDKPLCLRCEEKLVDRCTGVNQSAGVPCTSRAAPGCNGKCRRHKGQVAGETTGSTPVAAAN